MPRATLWVKEAWAEELAEIEAVEEGDEDREKSAFVIVEARVREG